MPQYTFTAFRWSGTGYNALYNTSYSAIIDDDDANLNGAADNNETDLPPEAPSFITRVCGFGFHILRRQFEQARRVRSPQIAQALGALQRVCLTSALMGPNSGI